MSDSKGATARGRGAIFLDRDGTVNVERSYITRPEELELLPGVAAAIRELRQAGFLAILITNQSAIARGLATEADIGKVHQRLASELAKSGAALDAVYLCPHHPDAAVRQDLKIACNCRKPSIGLIQQACRDFDIRLARSWMVGDQTRDMEMARRAELRSILVRTGVAGKDGDFDVQPDHVADDLAAAARLILRNQHALAAPGGLAPG
jgi:D,D-heptose 1,7-bisphosphate phosphatase